MDFVPRVYPSQYDSPLLTMSHQGAQFGHSQVDKCFLHATASFSNSSENYSPNWSSYPNFARVFRASVFCSPFSDLV